VQAKGQADRKSARGGDRPRIFTRPTVLELRAQELLQPHEADRLVQKGVDAEPGGFRSPFRLTVGGQDDHPWWTGAFETPRDPGGCPAVPVPQVGDHGVEREALQEGGGLCDGRRAMDVEAGSREVLGVRVPQRRVSVDHQQAIAHGGRQCKANTSGDLLVLQ
jgi:hypothetical protein